MEIKFSFYKPISTKNVYKKKIDKNTLELCKNLLLSFFSDEHYLKGKYGWLTSICYPYVDEYVLTIFNDWQYFLWTLDDRIDRSNGDLYNNDTKRDSIVRELLTTIENDVDVDRKDVDGHIRYLISIINRFKNHPSENTAACYLFWKTEVCDYIKNSWMIKFTNEKCIKKETSSYLRYRLSNSAFNTVLPLILFSILYDMPKIEDVNYWLKEQDIVRLQYLGNWIISLTNDIVSHEKEEENEGKNHVNLVKIYKKYYLNQNFDEKEVLEKTIFKIIRDVENMKEEFDLIKVRRFLPVWVSQYVEGIDLWIMAALAWSKRTNRYNPTYKLCLHKQ